MDKIESLRRGDGAARRASAMGRRQSLTTTNIQQYQEKQKEKTAKYKADRENRKVTLTDITPTWYDPPLTSLLYKQRAAEINPNSLKPLTPGLQTKSTSVGCDFR